MKMLQTSSAIFSDVSARHRSVLRATLSLFCEKGYFNTSVHEIVAKAEVSVGFVYHHFKDKSGLARALYEHLLTRMNELLDEIEDTYATAEQRCGAVIEMLFELTETEPEAMEYIIHARHREFLPAAKSICSTTAFVRMRRFVAEGVEAGEIANIDSNVAGALMYGAAIRLVCLRLDGVIDEPIDGYFDELWQRTWASLQA